jgi:general stress protein 26
MHETSAELDGLQRLIDASYARAGNHLAAIATPDRRMSAVEAVDYLQGNKHLVVATTTAGGEPRVSAVDGLFLHGSFWFSTSVEALKVHHLRRRPAVSAAHIVGDTVGIFAHGHAELTAGGTPEAAALAPYWRAVYDGASPEDWVSTPGEAIFVHVRAHTFLPMVQDRPGLAALVEASQSH